MATGFNTQIGEGKYRLQFETDRKQAFELMQRVARICTDGNGQHLRSLLAAEKDGRTLAEEIVKALKGEENETD